MLPENKIDSFAICLSNSVYTLKKVFLLVFSFLSQDHLPEARPNSLSSMYYACKCPSFFFYCAYIYLRVGKVFYEGYTS